MCTSTDTLNGCKDYSLKTAQTGIGIVSTANSNLDGTGTTTTVFTAADNGAVIKSIIIKATAQVTTGMVRIFIKKSNVTALYKEVPIQTTPDVKNTPIPAPVLPMFETCLTGNLELEAGSSIVVSTQIGNSFVVFVEGLNWDYPSTLPSDCCNFKQVTAVTGVGVVSTANPNLDGTTGSISAILTAPSSPNSNGTFVKNVTIKALQSTSINGMIRLFVSADGGTIYSLMREISVPQTVQSGFEPSYKDVIELNYHLQAGYIIGASTQNAEGFALTIEGEGWSYPI